MTARPAKRMPRPEIPSPAVAAMLLRWAATRVDSGRWILQCPAHHGKSSKSLELSLWEGRLTVTCLCGCATEDILANARRALLGTASADD